VLGVAHDWIEFPETIGVSYPNLKELHNDFRFADGISYCKFTTRYKSFIQYPGVLFAHPKKFLVVIYKGKKELEAYVNGEYIENNQSHKTLINQFAKKSGVRPKNIHYVSEEVLNTTFEKKLVLPLEEFDGSYQLEVSSRFIEQVKTDLKNE
jgi:hypothetical protein